MSNNFDRPPKAFCKRPYAETKSYAHGFENKPGKRLPKAGWSGSAGVGHARAECSIFDAETKGANVSAEIEASPSTLRASGKADLGSVSFSAGPVKGNAHAVVQAVAEVSFEPLEMINTFDRPAKACYKRRYVEIDSYENKPGKRFAGLSVSAGVGDVQAEWSIFEAEVKGPKASAGIEVSPGSLRVSAKGKVGSASASAGPLKAEVKGPNGSTGIEASPGSVRAFAKGELASASATVGLLKAKVGLAVDTGVGVGVTGVEAKVLGTGFSIGRKMCVSLLGNEINFSFW
ncbi:uncharacterized protein LOC139920436 [Centroberyx gerrardi]